MVNMELDGGNCCKIQKIGENRLFDDFSGIDMDDISFNYQKVLVGHRGRHLFKMGTYNDVVNKDIGEARYCEDSKNCKKMHF